MTSGRSASRLAAVLRLVGEIADEVVVAVEEPEAAAAFDELSSVADVVLSFPPSGPPDRQIAWLFESCTGDWLLNLDDDEVPSPALLSQLPGLVARDDITHAWLARRWLYRDCSTFLAQPPWSTEYQLRLVRADPALVQFSDEFHRPVICHGPCAFVDAPLWHLDTVLSPFERRRAKVHAYNLERPGMRIAGLAHNEAFYLPELQEPVEIESVPPEDARLIAQVLDAERAAGSRSAILVAASRDDVDREWPGDVAGREPSRGHVAASSPPHTMIAGAQQTVDVLVTNESGVTWRWGRDARPEIRLAYRWSRDGEPVDEPRSLRTPFPSDLQPGETQLVPVHVVPPSAPGQYALRIGLVHEHMYWFGSEVACEVEVEPRRRVVAIGARAQLEALFLSLERSAWLEPVVGARSSDGGATPADIEVVPSFHAALLRGLEGSARPTLSLRMLLRSVGVLSAALALRGGLRPARAREPLLRALLECEALVVCGPDWPGDAPLRRERLVLLTEIAAARALGRAVFLLGDSAEWAPRLARRLSAQVDAGRLGEWFAAL